MKIILLFEFITDDGESVKGQVTFDDICHEEGNEQRVEG